jgi:hypothetical protein
MKNILLSVFAAGILILSFSFKTGNIFPAITGEKLDGKKVTIPADTKGKFTLIGVAYSQKAQTDLQTWFQPVYTNFIEKPEGDVLFDNRYDVNIYFIPMFSGSNENMYGPAKKKLQDELDSKLKPHVLLYKGDISGYKKSLSLDQNDKPYFFVLNKQGEIVYTTSGAYTDEKLDKIDQLISEEE